MGRYAGSRRSLRFPSPPVRALRHGEIPGSRVLRAAGVRPGLRRHLESVSRLAAGLAKRHGADPGSAALAGCLHDILKDAPRARLAAIMRRCKVRLDPATRRVPSLWHGPAAAGFARMSMGVRAAGVLRAVRWHSTGRPRSDVLGEVVFIADYCAPDRDFREAAVGRRLARSDLRLAARYVMASKLSHLFARGIVPHPSALAHWRGLFG